MSATRLELLDDTYIKLKQLIEINRKREKKIQELFQAIAYDRELEKCGLKREDVKQALRGEYISRIDNCKLTHEVKLCTSDFWRCSYSSARKRFPMRVEICPDCQEPLTVKEVRISEFEFRNRYADYLVGVIDQNDKRHWFTVLVPPRV